MKQRPRYRFLGNGLSYSVLKQVCKRRFSKYSNRECESRN